jgi:heat shock protein HslJ
MLRLAPVVLLLAACAGGPDTDPAMIPPLDGTSWTLVTLGGEPALPAPAVTLGFEGPRVAGTGGVNRYFGGWSADGARLSFTDIGSTRMMGAPAAQQQENRYLAALREVDGAHLDGETLVLTSMKQPVMTLDPR